MKKRYIFALFVLFILFLPLLLRLLNQNYALPGTDIYSYLNRKSVDGESSFLGSLISYIPYILLSFLPLILTLTSFILFYLVLKQLKVKNMLLFFCLAIFVLSPFTQSLAFFMTSASFVLPLFLLGILFLLKKKLVFGSIPLIIASLISPGYAIVSILVLFLINKYFFNNKNIFYTIGVISVLLLIFHIGSLFDLSEIFASGIFETFFSEFGSYFGFGIFEVFLAVMGIAILFKHKNKFYSLILFSFLIVFFSFFFVNLRIFSLLIISFLGANVIYQLYCKKWSFINLKNIVLLTIFCGLFFATIFHANYISDSQPSINLAEGALLLASKEPGTVLTLQDYGDFIKFYSGKQNVLPHSDISSALYRDYLNMFYSDDISETIKLFKKYDVKYIIITSDMLSGKIWTKDDEGLLFLIKRSEHFKNILSTKNMHIWEVDYA